MPILRIEIVGEPKPPRGAAVAVAEGVGTRLKTSPNDTWVQLVPLPSELYAENGPEHHTPVIARLLMYRRPIEKELASLAGDLTKLIAEPLGRHPGQVHLVFEPDGAGRVAFGGRLVPTAKT